MASRLSTYLKRAVAGSPLRLVAFRRFYFGSIGAAIGYTMQATVAAWLMATLTPSALMVALVQTASTAPSLLFGLFAGALADIVDRRQRDPRHAGRAARRHARCSASPRSPASIGPVALLALTFLIGAGFTFYMPAQQASINEFVGARRPAARRRARRRRVQRRARRRPGARGRDRRAGIGTGSALLASALFFVPMIVAVRALAKPASSRCPAFRKRCCPACRAACATRGTRRRCAR